MSRRKLLWLLGAAAFVVGAVLLAIDGRMWDEGGPGIVGFELAFDEEGAERILAEWGEEGRDAARLSLWLDFLYLTLYGAFWVLAAAAVRDLARRREWRRLGGAGTAAVVAAAAAPVADALENVNLLLVLGGTGGGTTPLLAGVFATVKFLCLGLAVLYVVVGLLRVAFARFPRGARAAAAAGVLLVVGVLAANIWAVERETKPAVADGGRILGLAGGDLHVIDEGDPGDPAVVLIHGFTASTDWWAPVAGGLASDLRVIRVDLLGHGASEKPTEGYSMENQADLVAAAMRRLDLRRATVVGHSLGGLVATALAERHPNLVSGLMTIGSPPDDDHSPTSLGDRLGFVPVVGHVGWSLIPRRMVRAEIEGTFAPEIDVPAEIVDDTAGITYNVYRDSALRGLDYRRERSLPERFRALHLPAIVVHGTEDNRVDSSAAAGYRGIPGVRVVVLRGIGHNAQFEAPERTIALISELADRNR